MSEVNTNEKPKQEQSSLAPIAKEKRIMGWGSNTMLWLGGCISIGTLAQGSAQVEAGLNLLQLFLAVAIGSLILVVGIALNDQFSYNTGAPYAVQLRSAFGTKGNVVPSLIRGLPAIVWYGYQTWLGGAAINNISIALFGFDNIWVFFIVFQIVQILLSIKGFQGAKMVGNIGGVVISIAMIYLLYLCITEYGDVVSTKLIDKSGTWGMPFWAATTSFLGIYSTMIINASDYSRNATDDIKPVKAASIYTIAILPVTLFMGLIGLLVTAATGNSDPVVVFSTTMDNTFLTIMTLLFIAFAQVTTNVLNNIVPPAYVLMESFKVKWTYATILVGVLSVVVMPWKLVTAESAAGLNLFTQFYSAFLGPIFAVMAVDFYILRKKKLDLNRMYDKNGPYKGMNWAAVIAIIIGSICSLIIMELSWYVSLIPTGVIYYFLMKKMKSAEGFRVGTIFEDEK